MVDQRLLGALAACACLAACGGSIAHSGQDAGGGTGGTSSGGASATGGATSSGDAGGLCVSVTSKPGSCQATWTSLDPCGVLAPGQTIEAAVFPAQCPSDTTLQSGDTSAAVFTESAPEGQPLQPVTGLVPKQYGFALLVRDSHCHVLAWGCTGANLSYIKEIRTAVQPGGGASSCAAASGGTCAAGQTCNQGTCK